MRATNRGFSIEESRDRIRSILDSENSYEEVDNIPLETNVGLKDGYYVTAVIVSVDLRDSTGLLRVHQKRVVARILRSYISEITAVMNSPKTCRYLNIQGDGMFGVYNCRNQEEIREAYLVAPSINSVIMLLNKEYKRKAYLFEMKVGIGVESSKLLMIKGGFKGESINEVLWIGEAINSATHLAKIMNKENNLPVGVFPDIYDKLTDHSKSFLSLTYSNSLQHQVYVGNVVIKKFEEFIGSY